MSASASSETVSQLETDVLDWLRAALDDPDVSTTDNFLEIGGHSMMAIELNAFLAEKHHVTIKFASLFREQIGVALSAAEPGD